MKFILIDKSKTQKAEVHVETFRGNLIQGTLESHSFGAVLIRQLASFEHLVNTGQFAILDEQSDLLAAHNWTVQDNDWIVFDVQLFNEVDISFRVKDVNHSLEERQIYKKLEKLGYDNRWMMYNFLIIEDLKTQYARYEIALKNPDSEEADQGYQHAEHLRYGQFLKVSDGQDSFTNKQLEELIELVKCDDDPIMAQNLYLDLLKKKKVSAEQIKKYSEFSSS